ncbi:MAG: hypothetical protein A2521_12955 [Deltaproteobacteria bacterium RIFOXYD12_FULL_57_12]|nr:MAG: hypothetical protein A2521_12955 [Deltaproteobacteria bacterium RIFOXYD12_FULL_57_12]
MIRFRLDMNTVAITGLLFLLISCSPSLRPPDVGDKSEAMLPVKTIGVLPVEIQADSGGRPPAVVRQLEAGAAVLDGLLAEYFQEGRGGGVLVSQTRLDGLSLSGSGEVLARNIGRQLGVDAVLVSQLSRYRQRVGGSYASERPASVAFELTLVAAADGRTLWHGLVDETQRSVLENLLKLPQAASRKFQWVSVEELAREGLVKKLDSCPYLKGDGQASQ